MSKIKKFIEDNNLSFKGSGSGLNSNYCIISGYALYIELTLEVLEKELVELKINTDGLEKVFNYADDHDYGDWWRNPNADSMYKFDKID